VMVRRIKNTYFSLVKGCQQCSNLLFFFFKLYSIFYLIEAAGAASSKMFTLQILPHSLSPVLP